MVESPISKRYTNASRLHLMSHSIVSTHDYMLATFHVVRKMVWASNFIMFAQIWLKESSNYNSYR